jgi:hypothetical protein
MSRQALAARGARFAARAQYEHLARVGQNEPHYRHAVIEVPARLLAEHVLFLVLARDLDGEDWRYGTDLSRSLTHVSLAPDREVCSPDIASQLHSRFVAANDEVTPRRPVTDDNGDAGRHI